MTAEYYCSRKNPGKEISFGEEKKILGGENKILDFKNACLVIENFCKFAEGAVEFNSSLPEHIQVILILEKLFLFSSGMSAFGISWIETEAEKLGPDFRSDSSSTSARIENLKLVYDKMVERVKDFAIKSGNLESENTRLTREVNLLKEELAKKNWVEPRKF